MSCLHLSACCCGDVGEVDSCGQITRSVCKRSNNPSDRQFEETLHLTQATSFHLTASQTQHLFWDRQGLIWQLVLHQTQETFNLTEKSVTSPETQHSSPLLRNPSRMSMSAEVPFTYLTYLTKFTTEPFSWKRWEATFSCKSLFNQYLIHLRWGRWWRWLGWQWGSLLGLAFLGLSR